MMGKKSQSWAQDALEALKDVEGYKHQRLELMQRALKKSENSRMCFGSIPVAYDAESGPCDFCGVPD
jgi:hypothetical protein